MFDGASVRSGFQAVLRTVYPPRCMACNGIVGTDNGLCGSCWRDTPFITGLICDLCGAPLPGEESDAPVHCDDCLHIARPWSRGRAVMVYRDNARRMVLAFKHGDRTEMARATGAWMAYAGRDILLPGQVVVPAPLHWRRLFARRYNQAALLGAAVARHAGLMHCPDLLRRPRSTGTQGGRDREGRFANLQGAIAVHPRRATLIDGRPVLIVDDVMTSGATFAACAETCLAAGASDVRVLALARVVKDS